MKPILFNTEMVRAILDGRKTVTRRVVKPSALERFVIDDNGELVGSLHPNDKECIVYPSVDDSPFQHGDILYVRETWCNVNTKEHPAYFYKADNNRPHDFDRLTPWRPSIHMPREAARIFLMVTDVRVERLKEITEDQARAEGVTPVMITTDVEKPDSEKVWHEWFPALPGYIALWDRTIKKSDRPIYGWDSNPWVWVIEFERISKEDAKQWDKS